MNKLLIFAVLCLVSISAHSHAHIDIDSLEGLIKVPKEAFYDFTLLATTLGYPVEQHTVQTQDGYLLTYYRLQAKNTQIRSGLPVAFLNHGLLDSSDSFVVNDEGQAPGFLLANAGYDVWVANNRGNKYAVAHVDPSFDADDGDNKFWQFSWQEMSQYDLPAGIKYVAGVTGQKVNYIGHSEGCTIMFAALARRDPTVVQYLNKFIALAPAVFLQHSTSPLVQVAGWIKAGKILEAYSNLIDKQKFGWMTTLTRKVYVTTCVLANTLCVARVRLLSDADTSVDNVKRFKVTSGHYPAGSSIQNMVYWSQMFNSPVFSMYDYGKKGNIQVYGTQTPPEYDLSKITEDIYMFVGKFDHLASPADTATLRGKLTGSSRVEYRTYDLGHGSFIWGKDVATYVNDVLAVLRQ